jgi:hypothetical protein
MGELFRLSKPTDKWHDVKATLAFRDEYFKYKSYKVARTQIRFWVRKKVSGEFLML